MSTTVDERVVEMRFDNKQFEQNIQTSLSSIDKLKHSLNLEGAAKGLESVNTAASRCNMSPLSNAVETVKIKFSAMEVMALTALQNITNSALHAGERLVSAFTIDPVKSGFQEYETQINAVQTILANTSSKGTTLDQVNNALDELNHYADMTIYNFTEMTRNIGTFTAAGVDLDTSVSAIKGIANLAAVSGSNSQQASTAMYQLSQALAAGTVKLQDWNSVVNAGMGGQVFQDALKDTARAHHIAIDELIKDEGSFRETLSKGWLTSDILTETLSKFTGDLNADQLRTMGYTDEQIQSIIKMGQTANDAATKVKTFSQLFDTLKEAAQSGWTQSWEIIVGDFEEAKELLTEVSDTFSALINASSDARNTMLQDWKDLGGRTMMIEAVKNTFEGLMAVVKPIREAFNEIFPPMTGKQLADITEKIRNLTANFKMSDETTKNLKSTFRGVFAVVDIVGQAFKAVAGGIVELIKLVAPAGSGILGLTGNFGEYLVKLDETIKNTNIFGNVISNIVGVISFVVNLIKTAISTVKEFGKAVAEKINFPGFELLHSFLERINEHMSQVGTVAGKMKEAVVNAFEAMSNSVKQSSILDAIGAIWERIKTVATNIINIFGIMTKKLAKSLGIIDFNSLLDMLNTAAFGGLVLSISNFSSNLFKPVEGISGLINSLKGVLKDFGGVFKGAAETLDSVRGCFEAYQEKIKAKVLLTIGLAIAILAGSIVVLSLIDSNKLLSALGAITVLFANLEFFMKSFNKIGGSSKQIAKASGTMIAMSISVSILAGALKKVADLDWDQLMRGLTGIAGLSIIVAESAKNMSKNTKSLVKGASGLVFFAVAIKVLASACKDMAEMQWEEMGRGLTGVGVLMAEVSLFLNTAKFSAKAPLTATGIVILAAALKILASVCKDFAVMQWEEIGKGLTAIGALLLEIAAFTNLAGNAKHVISTGIALVAIGGAMKIFASAVSDFAAMQWDAIGRGLAAMGGALAEVAIAVNLMPKNTIGIGAGLVIVSLALKSLAEAMASFGGMQWDEIGRGLAVLGGALAELTIALNLMKGTLGGSAALLIAAGALNLLVPVLTSLGRMSWSEIVRGLTVLAGSFTILGIAGTVLAPLVPTIIALAGAFTLVGLGVLGVGAGLMAAGAGLSAIAVGFTTLASAGAIGATAVVAALSVIITGVAGLIPAVIEKIGEGVVAFAGAIAAGMPAISEAFIAILDSLLSLVVEATPKILDSVGTLLTSILNSVKSNAPGIIQSAMDILLSILKGIGDNIPKITQAGINIMLNFMNAIATKLPDIIQAGVNIISGFLEGIAKTVPQVLDAGFKMMIDFINGLADATEKNIPLLMQAIGNLVKAIISGITKGLMGGVGDCLDAGKNMMLGFIKGIKSKFGDIVKAAKDTVSGAVDSIKEFLGIHSPSTLMAELGEYSGEGYEEGLLSTEPAVEDAGEDVAESAYSGMEKGSKKGLENFRSSMTEEEKKSLLERSQYWTNLINVVDAGVEKKNSTEQKAVQDSKVINNQNAQINNERIQQEESYWARLLAEKQKGAEAEKYQSMSMVDFRRSIVEQSIDILKNYTDTLKSTTDSRMNDSSMFTDVLTSSDLTKKLNEQISELEEYKTVITSLNERIADGGLKDAINKMGVDSLDELKLINGMTDDELSNYVSLYDQKYALCQEAAAVQLSGLQTETETKLSELYGGAQVNLQTFAQSFDGTFESIRGYVGQSVEIGGQIASGVAEGITQNTASTEDAAKQMIDETEQAAKDAADIHSPSVLFRDEVGSYITQGVAEGMVDETAKASLKSSADEVMDYVVQSFTESDSKDKFTQVGTDIVDACKDGITQQEGALSTQCGDTMTAALTEMQNAVINFKPTLQSNGSDLVSSFIAGVNSQNLNVTNTFTTIIQGILNAITAKKTEFYTMGSSLVAEFVKGINAEDENAKSAFINIVSACLTAIKNKYYEFQSTGETVMTNFIGGVKAKEYETKSAFSAIVDSSIEEIRSNYERFHQAGAYLVEGFANGITENTFMAEAKARAMARAAADAAEDELDEHSPSRVGYHIGDFFGLGFVNAIGTYGVKAYNASADMAKSAKTGLQDAISKVVDMMDENIDYQPTIRPVLDLSEVESKSHKLNTLFSRTQAITLGGSINASKAHENQNGDSGLNGGNSYKFIQNNYSPKALSRTEIYRQTKNQFSAMERMVET